MFGWARCRSGATLPLRTLSDKLSELAVIADEGCDLRDAVIKLAGLRVEILRQPIDRRRARRVGRGCSRRARLDPRLLGQGARPLRAPAASDPHARRRERSGQCVRPRARAGHPGQGRSADPADIF